MAQKSKQIILKTVRFYQKFLSPLFPPACRFTPTCSQYAIDAIEKYPLGKALWMTTSRLLRCHPFHPGGYDPVK